LCSAKYAGSTLKFLARKPGLEITQALIFQKALIIVDLTEKADKFE
jgi:hypothetical protein